MTPSTRLTWLAAASAAALVLVAASGVAHAQYAPAPPPPPQPYQPYAPAPQPGAYYAPATPPGWHEHDGGLFRLTLGPAAGAIGSDDGSGNTSSVAGSGGQFSLGVGWALSRSLVAMVELSTFSASDLTVDVNGSTGSLDGTLAIVYFGFGGSLYLPSNFYLHGTLGPLGAVVQPKGAPDQDGEGGFAVNLAVGKEWWVSTDWGLGVSLSMLLGAVAPENSDTADGVAQFALSFSATYN